MKHSITKEQLEDLYWNQNLGINKIARKLGISRGHVHWLMRKYDIPRRPPPKRKFPLSKQELYDLYHKQGMSYSQIAKKIGVSKSTVEFWMKKYNIKSRFSRWTEDEDKILRKYYKSSSRELILKLLPKRSWDVIRNRAKKLGLHRLQPHKKCRVRQLLKHERAWLACAIDGEGSITFTREGKNIFPRVAIYNKNRRFVVEAKRMVGVGNVAQIKNDKYPNRDDIWVFYLSATEAVLKTLRQITPFLIIKRKQAELVKEFCEIRLKATTGEGYGKREWEIYRKVRKLNARSKKTYKEPI